MAYGNIKGITIEINGDTSKLTTALKNVDKEARTTSSTLRDINKAMKFDTKNGPELAAQKQRELARAIENTKEKLKILKQGQAEMTDEFKKTNEGSRAYDNLTREIDKAERQLKSFEAQSDKTFQKLAKVRDLATDFGKSAQEMGGKLTKRLTAPIAGLAGIAGKITTDFDANMSKVQAISGVSEQSFISLRDKAREMGATTQFSASEAAEALTYMAMAGWKDQDMINGLDGVMNLAAASGEDLATTSDIVTDAITAFGLTAKDSAHFADVLAAASSNSNTNVALMGETFKYAAPIAGTLGYSVEDTAVAIGLMANNGIKGSQAGTALRTGLTRLASPTKQVEEGMAMLGLSIEDVQGLSLDETLRVFRSAFSDLDGTQQAQAASLIFGQQAMSGMLGIINTSEDDYNALSNAINNADGSAENMAKTMQDNLGGKIKILKSALEELAISFGDLLMPKLKEVVDGITDFVNKLNELPAPAKELILGIGLFLAAIGPILLIVGKISSGIGLISGALAVMQGSMVGATPAMIGLAKMFSFIKFAFAGLKTLLLAHPIAAVVIGAIAIAIPLIIKNWDTIKEFLINTWNSIKEIAINIWNGLKDFFINIWTGITEAWSAFWDTIGEWLGQKFETIKLTLQPYVESFINFFKVMWMFIQEVFSTSWEVISGLMTQLFEIFVQLVSTIFSPIKDFFVGLWEGIKEVSLNIWTAIKDTISSIWQSLVDFANPIFEQIRNTVTSVWESIKSVSNSIWEAIKSFITNIWNGINSVVTSVINAISSTVSSVWNSIKSTTSNIWNGIKSSIETPINNAKNTVSNVINNIKSNIINGWNSIKNTTSSVWNSIKTAIENPINRAKNAVQNAIDRMKSILNINLPVPRIKLPHFSVSGHFSLKPPSVPHFSVDWYKKGAIFTRPTLFNTQFGMKGVGEAGAEAVLPIEKLDGIVASALEKAGGSGAGVLITGNTFNVREDKDIELIARELDKLIRRRKRGTGF